MKTPKKCVFNVNSTDNVQLKPKSYVSLEVEDVNPLKKQDKMDTPLNYIKEMLQDKYSFLDEELRDYYYQLRPKAFDDEIESTTD
jgi:hypothetical protein